MHCAALTRRDSSPWVDAHLRSSQHAATECSRQDMRSVVVVFRLVLVRRAPTQSGHILRVSGWHRTRSILSLDFVRLQRTQFVRLLIEFCPDIDRPGCGSPAPMHRCTTSVSPMWPKPAPWLAQAKLMVWTNDSRKHEASGRMTGAHERTAHRERSVGRQPSHRALLWPWGVGELARELLDVKNVFPPPKLV